MNTALLAGITVLDLSRLLPGPLATWHLARLFAEKPLSHWNNVFAGVDCCVTPVLRMDEVLEHPVSAEYLTSLPAGEGGSAKTLRSGVRVLS